MAPGHTRSPATPPAITRPACAARSGSSRRSTELLMIVAIALTPEGTAGQGWGRAPRVAIARVDDGRIEAWAVHDVRWDLLHDEGSEGGHHARIARFLREHDVGLVIAGHMGPPMVQMLARMNIAVRLGAEGDARAAVLAAAAS